MALIEGLTGSAALAVGIFLVLVFAQYAKVRDSAPKGFGFLAAGAVFLLLEAATMWSVNPDNGPLRVIGGIDAIFGPLQILWTVIAWLLVLGGTVFVAKDLLMK